MSSSLLDLLPISKPSYNKDIMSLPTTGIVSLTNRCNLACNYCFNNPTDNDMTLDVAERVARYLLANAAITKRKPEINFFGGEPLLMFNTIIVPLIKKYGDAFSWGMTTNGTLLDEGIINWLYKHNVSLLLSMDGCQQVQDQQRPMKNGNSSYQVLSHILPYVLIYYPNLTMRGTLTRAALPYLVETVQTIKNFGFSNFTLIPNLFEEWQHNDYALWRDFVDHQAIQLMRYVLLQEPLEIKFNNLISSVHEVDEINKINELKLPYTSCGLGMRGIGISTQGKLYPCQEYNSTSDELAIGDIEHGVNTDLQEHYCNSVYDNWLTYLNCIDKLDTSLNFKLYYANHYCSTRIMETRAFSTTQTAFLKGLHQSASRLFYNYSLTLNPFARELFNL